MKIIRLEVTPVRVAGRVVARFGLAALVQERLGSWRLLGGSPRDRLAAREWVSLFAHDVLVDCRSADSELRAGAPTRN